MNLLCKIALIIISTSIVLAENTDDPKLSELDRNTVIEILAILTKGVLKLRGECPEPKSEGIVLYLYNRTTSLDPIEIDHYNPYQVDTNKKVIIIIHGFLSGADTNSFQKLKNAYLDRYDCNVIIVHWKEYAISLYTTAACMLPKIATLIGNFMCNLAETKNYNLENIHIVGHSLGAHMAGLAGQVVAEQCNQRIGRITGLDPAGPLFLGRHISERLDSTDAEFVDIIHTNGGIFGHLTSTGHVDFYPNCGSLQFCKAFVLSLSGILDLPVSVVTCHHSVSVDYMSEGVRTNNFKGIPCKSCSLLKCPPVLSIFNQNKPIMGEKCPNTTRGDYYVPVNTREPFALTIF